MASPASRTFRTSAQLVARRPREVHARRCSRRAPSDTWGNSHNARFHRAIRGSQIDRYALPSDLQPHISGGVVAGEVNVPATGRDEPKTRSPLVARPVVTARRMRFRAEYQRLSSTVGSREVDTQRAAPGHSPDDLQLVTYARRNMARPECKSPELSVAALTMYLVGCTADCEPSRHRASGTGRDGRRCGPAARHLWRR